VTRNVTCPVAPLDVAPPRPPWVDPDRRYSLADLARLEAELRAWYGVDGVPLQDLWLLAVARTALTRDVGWHGSCWEGLL
jgi:hypothetical protein